jgi:hypothetical protein
VERIVEGKDKNILRPKRIKKWLSFVNKRENNERQRKLLSLLASGAVFISFPKNTILSGQWSRLINIQVSSDSVYLKRSDIRDTHKEDTVISLGKEGH